MHPTAAEFVERTAERYGFEPDVRGFPEGTKTAADAAEAVGCDLAQITKSIVMVVAGEVVVVLTSGANRVDEAALAAEYGVAEERVRSANPDEVKETLGWSIGGVPPFAHETSVDTLLDPRLTDFEEIWAAAGTPEAVFPLSPERLRECAEPRVVDVFE